MFDFVFYYTRSIRKKQPIRRKKQTFVRNYSRLFSPADDDPLDSAQILEDFQPRQTDLFKQRGHRGRLPGPHLHGAEAAGQSLAAQTRAITR